MEMQVFGLESRMQTGRSRERNYLCGVSLLWQERLHSPLGVLSPNCMKTYEQSPMLQALGGEEIMRLNHCDPACLPTKWLGIDSHPLRTAGGFAWRFEALVWRTQIPSHSRVVVWRKEAPICRKRSK